VVCCPPQSFLLLLLPCAGRYVGAELSVACAGPGGMGVDSAALADLEGELGEIKRHAVIIDDVKMQLMAVSDRLNALTEFLVSDTSASKSTRQFQVHTSRARWQRVREDTTDTRVAVRMRVTETDEEHGVRVARGRRSIASWTCLRRPLLL
jgi:hypothetical protein